MPGDFPVEYRVQYERPATSELSYLLNLSPAKELEFIDSLLLTDEVLGSLPSTLESLKIVRCRNITDYGISSLHFLTKLKVLSINNCIGISGSTFDSLPSSLRSLHVIDCQNFGDKGMQALNFLSLTKLQISECPITGLAFSVLPLSLKTLKIQKCCKIKERFLVDLCRFNHLKKLDLSLCPIRGCNLFLPPFLESLTLAKCHNLVDFDFLVGANHLHFLDLSWTPFCDFHSPFLATLKLKKLVIEGCNYHGGL